MTQRTAARRNERNIPLSEGFEICFCLIVSEREIRGRGERAQTEVQRNGLRLTEEGGGQSVSAALMRTAAGSENASQREEETH